MEQIEIITKSSQLAVLPIAKITPFGFMGGVYSPTIAYSSYLDNVCK